MQILIDKTINLIIGISSCLLGESLRYDGSHKRNSLLLETFGNWVQWLPICPEVEVGMGVPRESLSLFGNPDDPRMLTNETQIDHTQEMRAWAEKRLMQPDLEKIHGYILKSCSPSCGLFDVPVFPSTLQDEPQMGRGLFAKTLLRKFPNLPIEEESGLQDPAILENFIERVLAYADQKENAGSA